MLGSSTTVRNHSLQRWFSRRYPRFQGEMIFSLIARAVGMMEQIVPRLRTPRAGAEQPKRLWA